MNVTINASDLEVSQNKDNILISLKIPLGVQIDGVEQDTIRVLLSPYGAQKLIQRLRQLLDQSQNNQEPES